MAAHVFVSHASADRPTVERVVERLDAAGIPAWASYKAIAAGSEYSREIDKSIASAQALVVLISKASNQSREVLKEVELALKYDRTVVPIIIEAGITPAGGLAYHLSPKSWIDWTRSPETAIECVVSAMCGVPHAGFARAHLAVSMAPVASDVPWCDTQSTCYERIDDASLIRPLKAGSRIGDYRVVEHIASSNFSFGYKIENVLEGKLLFAKEFSPKSLVKNRAESGFLNWDVDGLFGSKTRALKKQRADFEQSGAIIKKLHHAQIPSFVGIINANNTAYIVSELVHGSAWSSYLDVHKKITSHEVLQFFKVILPVIGYCHNQSIFHSDIQPSNIIISAGRLPVMVDFGAAIDLSSAQTPVAIKAITQGFSPPEVIAAGAKPISRSAIGPWIDLFSIAAVAFLSISGRLPQIGALETEINSLTYQHGAPPQLAAAIGWCLNIDANRRPRRVDDVLNLVQSGS